MTRIDTTRTPRRLRRGLFTALTAVVLVLSLSSSAFAWGQVLVSGSSYGGVSVYSNFPRPYPYDARGDSGWGTRYQCVELAQRLYNQMGWLGVRNWGVRYAHQMYSTAPKLGLQVVPNGGGRPAWGDLIVWNSASRGSGGAGHVAVVTSVSSTRVNIVEENGSPTGRRSLPYSNGRILDSTVIGWVKRPLTSSVGAFDVVSTGDVTGDGRADVTLLVDYGNATSALYVFKSNGASFAPYVWWRSAAGGFRFSAAKMTAGDVDGDGRKDIIALYDYGNRTSGMWVFRSNGSSFTAKRWWRSDVRGFNWAGAKLAAGDVTGDGRADAVALYDYGSRTTGLWTFASTGSRFVPRSSWRSDRGGFSASSSKLAMGDVNGDRRSDAIVLYDYGRNTSGLWSFLSNGSRFTAKPWWRSDRGGFRWGAAKLASGDTDGNGRSDAVVFFDYGNRTSGMWSFLSTGSRFVARSWWRSDRGGFAAAGNRLGVGDVDGNGRADAVVLYDHGSGRSSLWSFLSNGSRFTARSSWRGGYYASMLR